MIRTAHTPYRTIVNKQQLLLLELKGAMVCDCCSATKTWFYYKKTCHFFAASRSIFRATERTKIFRKQKMARISQMFCFVCTLLAITAAVVSADDASGMGTPPPAPDPMSALMPTPAMRGMMDRMRTMMMLSPVIDAVCEIDERMQANAHGDKPPNRPGECWMCLRACRMDSQCFQQCRKQINPDDDGSMHSHSDIMQPFMKNQECQDLNKCYNMTCSRQMILAMNDANNMWNSSNSGSSDSSASTPMPSSSMQMPMAKMRTMLNQVLLRAYKRPNFFR